MKQFDLYGTSSFLDRLPPKVVIVGGSDLYFFIFLLFLVVQIV